MHNAYQSISSNLYNVLTSPNQEIRTVNLLDVIKYFDKIKKMYKYSSLERKTSLSVSLARLVYY